jgi:hypothetical protein
VEPSLPRLCFWWSGVLALLSARRETLPFAWRRVIAPRRRRIWSTMWMPSGAFGFFGRM